MRPFLSPGKPEYRCTPDSGAAGPRRIVVLFSCQITRDTEHPRAVADRRAGSHDEYGMCQCRRLRKLLKSNGEIVVIGKVASAGRARLCAGSRHPQRVPPKPEYEKRKDRCLFARSSVKCSYSHGLRGVKVVSPESMNEIDSHFEINATASQTRAEMFQ